MWDAGLAHRDIKPSNLLLADGQVWLIDVAFAEVRPEPVAAGRRPGQHDADPVALRACRARVRAGDPAVQPDEIAEAFAASGP
jgi:serine/threonine protein kinase